MKYEVILDINKSVEIIRHTGTIRDYVELDLSEYDLTDGRIHAYKLGKNCLIWDQKKWDEIVSDRQEKADQAEIKDLKQKLYETDYIMSRCYEEILSLSNPLTWIADVIKINTKYAKEYKDAIAKRKIWRARIEELEG